MEKTHLVPAPSPKSEFLPWCGCRYMFFIEIPESVRSIESQALGGGGLLHNVSISPDAVIEDGVLPPQLQNILGPDSEKNKMR